MKYFSSLLTAFATTVACLVALPVSGDDSDAVVKESTFLLRSVEAAREKLTEGAFELRGFRQVKLAKSETTDAASFRGEADVFCAFDYLTDRIRYDSRTPAVVRTLGPAIHKENDLGKQLRESQGQLSTMQLNSVRKDEYFAWYTSTTRGSRTNVEIFQHDEKWTGGLNRTHHLFDVRAVGLFNFLQFTGNLRDASAAFPDAVDTLLELQTVSVSRQNGLAIIRLQRDGAKNISLAIEEATMTPVSFRILVIDDSQMNSEVTWQQINGVAVPEKFDIEMIDWPAKGDMQRYSYTFHWSHVNVPVPEHFFDYADFPDVMDGTPVVDNRTGRPVPVGVWYEGASTALADVPKPTRASKRTESKTTSRWVLLNIAALILIAVILAIRSWRRHRGQSSRHAGG